MEWDEDAGALEWDEQDNVDDPMGLDIMAEDLCSAKGMLESGIMVRGAKDLKHAQNTDDRLTVTKPTADLGSLVTKNISCCPLHDEMSENEAIWMLDSGASWHFTYNTNDFVELEDITPLPIYTANGQTVSRTQLLTSKISHVFQEIRDIKSQRKPQTNIAVRNYTNTGLAEEQTSPNYTQERGNNSSAKEDTGDGDDWGGTYSSHSTLCPHEPSNPDNPSCHAPAPPSLNPPPSGSIPEPPGDRSPSPTSKIGTLIPSLLVKLERKACNAALSSSVHTNPSRPCAAWNILPSTWNGLGEDLEEESVMREESLSVTGDRGGGPGVGGLCPERGGGTGMVIDKEGGAEDNQTLSGTGSPSPLQIQQMES